MSRDLRSVDFRSILSVIITLFGDLQVRFPCISNAFALHHGFVKMCIMPLRALKKEGCMVAEGPYRLTWRAHGNPGFQTAQPSTSGVSGSPSGSTILLHRAA